MKNKDELNGSKHFIDEKMTNEKECTTPSEQKHLGDIDELIFPDDEPYYISER